MSGTMRAGLALSLAAASAGAALGAEALRLRPAGAVYADAKGAGLRAPEGVACGPDGLLAVADTGNGRLVVYEVRTDAVVPRADFALPELPHPIRVRADAAGDLLVLDGKLRKIGRVSARGEFRGYVDLAVAGGSVVPRSFRLDGEGRLAVLDVAGGRVLFFEADGKPGREIRFPEAHGFFSDLAIDGEGTVYLLDSVGRRVFAAAAGASAAAARTAGLEGDLDFATSLESDDSGRLLLVDRSGGGIVVLGADGALLGRRSASGWKEGLLRDPAAIALDGKGLAFVADRGNNRVQIFEIVR